MQYHRKLMYNQCVRFYPIQNFINSDICSVKDLDRLSHLLTFLDCAKTSRSISTCPYCMLRSHYSIHELLLLNFYL